MDKPYWFAWIWIIVMAACSFSTRALPLLLFKKPIENKFFQSFLYYVPYVTLAVMTFPAILMATQVPLAGALALLVGVAVALWKENLFITAGSCCLVVFVVEFFLV